MVLAITAEGVHKSFHSGRWRKKVKPVLQGIDLAIEQGEIFGILGPNGVGKTTLLSILSTLLLPDRGRVEILGLDLLRHGCRVRQRINSSSGHANFLWGLTVRENLNLYGMLYGLGRKVREAKVASLIDLLDLGEHRDATFDQLSTGLKQRLSLAKALINDPEILFLDEPTVGLDPSVSLRIREEVRSIQKQRGMTVLFTTHNMKEAEVLCDRISFLRAGRLLATGTAADLKRMIRIGDLVRVEYQGTIVEDALLHADGVINFSASGGVCEIIVDDGEKRLGPLVEVLALSGAGITKVTLGQTDLEDVFIEFAKDGDPDLGLRL
jgi:ABC-2 type transport system ATP-binding protein